MEYTNKFAAPHQYRHMVLRAEVCHCQCHAICLWSDCSSRHQSLRSDAMDLVQDCKPSQQVSFSVGGFDKNVSLLVSLFHAMTGISTQGKMKNFAHPALQQVITEFFYASSYCIADKHPDLFHNTIPISCLALVPAAISYTFPSNTTPALTPLT